MNPAVASAETAPWHRQAGGRTAWPPDAQRNAPVVEPPTDQLPQYAPTHTNGAAPGQLPVDGPGPVDHGTALLPDERLDESGEPTMAGVPLDDLDARDAAAFGPTDDVVGEGDGAPAETRRADRTAVTEGSPTTAWLAMVAQWIGGAIGGAALWVAFRYLWTAMPVVALVAAVLVTGGLVLLVRAIRRSDDLRTTVFAVLVGLVVTVSPAVLVLVTR